MAGRVASFEGLRKAVENELKSGNDRKPLTRNILGYISEFEAGVRENNLTDEEIELLEGWVVGFLYGSDRLSNEDYDKLKVAVEKLKRLCKSLGEGAEG